MALKHKKHKVVQELDRRGIRTRFFCELHNIKLTDFYQTTSGIRMERKCVKALHKEGMLDLLLEEFPNFKEKIEGMFL